MTTKATKQNGTLIRQKLEEVMKRSEQRTAEISRAAARERALEQARRAMGLGATEPIPKDRVDEWLALAERLATFMDAK